MADEVTDCSNNSSLFVLDGLIKVLMPIKTLLELTMLVTLKQTLLLSFYQKI